MKALNQPESWWGWHGYNHPEAMSITEILRAGTMPPRLAAALWLAMERGLSVILAADPPGAGKTTILTALLAFTRSTGLDPAALGLAADATDDFARISPKKRRRDHPTA